MSAVSQASVLELEVKVRWNGLEHTVMSRIEPVFTGDFRYAIDEAIARTTKAVAALTEGLE